jgi:hypothetical protein
VAARRKDIAPLVSELIEWMKRERGKLSRHNEVAKAMDYMAAAPIGRLRIRRPRSAPAFSSAIIISRSNSFGNSISLDTA